jgi:hypothetical protein
LALCSPSQLAPDLTNSPPKGQKLRSFWPKRESYPSARDEYQEVKP